MTVETESEQNSKEKLSLFKEKYIKLKSCVEECQMEEFGRLKTDQERIKFVSEIVPLEALPEFEISSNGKDEKMAKELKESGNKAFGKNDFTEALKCYNECILKTPQSDGNIDLVLALANRSAVFYHLQKYELVMKDIDVVLSLNYPKELKYKVLERKAKCLLALKRNEEALQEFRNTIRALDDSKLSSEKKMKMQTDIQIMMGIMTRAPGSGKEINGFSQQTEQPKDIQYKPKLSSARNQIYEAASDKVEIKEDPSSGRFASAAQDISAGETLLIEKAFCSVLLSEFSKTNCQHCFRRTLAPYPCPGCCDVVFCCSDCRESAVSSYHKYECKVLQTISKAGVSVTVLMALRILSQQSLQTFLDLRPRLTEDKRNIEKYTSFDYLAIYHLVRHEKARKTEDFFERSVMALFLLQALRKGNYFPDSKSEDNKKFSDEEIFIGSLLLRHLQILQFNAHEISELEMKSEKTVENSKSVFIGGGLYTTLALFNHSCDPGIVRYFDGTKVIVRAVKPIKKGEMIAENYGPIYSQTKKKERQEKLLGQYWFRCSCVPCEEVWPTFEEIDKKMIRFRCDARGESGERLNDCLNVLSVPVNTEEFMVKCFMCKKFTNLFKGLKTLQDTDGMYKQALSLSNKGNHQQALAVYLKILTMLHEILAPPFRDYLLCQQSIRKCMLTFGNKYVKEL